MKLALLALTFILISFSASANSGADTCVNLTGNYRPKFPAKAPYLRLLIKQYDCNLLYVKSWITSEPRQGFPQSSALWIRVNEAPVAEEEGSRTSYISYTWEEDSLVQTVELRYKDGRQTKVIYNRLFFSGKTLIQSSESFDPITLEPETFSYEYLHSEQR